MFRGGSLFGWEGGAFFVFDLYFEREVEGLVSWIGMEKERRGTKVTYSDFEIDEFLLESTHVVIEAETILSHLLRRKHEITLPLFRPIHYNFFIWSLDLVVDIERAAGLDL